MKVQWVRQEDRLGCSIAVLAMITGLSYQDVRAAVGFNGNLGSSCGARQVEWLREHGFETTICFHKTSPACPADYDRRADFIPVARPYLLWLSVGPRVGEGIWRHSVLQLPDGTIWDPEHSAPRRLTDYPELWQVRVVVPMEAK